MSGMILTQITQALAPHGLMVMGHAPDPDDAARTVVLVGADAGCWQVFTAAPEYSDALPNPLDRWSKRIIGALAAQCDGSCVFPSDGPPYAPFIAWAMASGRFWQSPTGMMVHDCAGLMISLRGAIFLPERLPSGAQGTNPCDSCADRPCVTACPVDALSDQHFYDVPACKTHIASPHGAPCMRMGCATRLACPVSKSFDRPAAQSAFHMRSFRGA